MLNEAKTFYHKKFNSNLFVCPHNAAHATRENVPSWIDFQKTANMKSFSSFSNRNDVDQTFYIDQLIHKQMANFNRCNQLYSIFKN